MNNEKLICENCGKEMLVWFRVYYKAINKEILIKAEERDNFETCTVYDTEELCVECTNYECGKTKLSKKDREFLEKISEFVIEIRS